MVVESSSKENVETEKHIPFVCRFKVDKHIQPRKPVVLLAIKLGSSRDQSSMSDKRRDCLVLGKRVQQQPAP